jgi:undecaprenyl-diphosphatase
MMELLQVILLGIVEGLTEFLPVSSTGHLLLCERWMGLDLDGSPFWKMFTVVIQIGAIAAVVVYFRKRIVDLLRRSAGGISAGGRPTPLAAVLAGTVPVLIVGFLIHKWVEKHLEHPFPVAMALAVGGLLMILVEWARPTVHTDRMEGMSWLQAVGVGLYQILAVLFPGTSGSAATILGGMTLGMGREAAAEFSFFLAIPAMSAACGYSLLKGAKAMLAEAVPGQFGRQMLLLAIGTLVSYLVAWVVIGMFMNYVRRRSFTPFGVYRLLLAAVVLLGLWQG